MRSCVLTDHLADGSTAVRIWEVTDVQAERIAAWLGAPVAEQLLTPEQSEAADGLADQVLTIHQDSHTTS